MYNCADTFYPANQRKVMRALLHRDLTSAAQRLRTETVLYRTRGAQDRVLNLINAMSPLLRHVEEVEAAQRADALERERAWRDEMEAERAAATASTSR